MKSEHVRMVAILQKVYSCNSEALIRGFELLISGNHTQGKSLCSRGMESGCNNILSPLFDENKKFLFF